MSSILKQSITVALLGSVLVGVQLFAFTEPSVAPPGGNVPGPVTTGSVVQTKSGNLTISNPGITALLTTDKLVTIGGAILNSGGAVNGLLVDKGNVGIGVSIPVAKLDVEGKVRIAGGVGNGLIVEQGSLIISEICLSGLCRKSWPGSNQYTPGTYSFTIPAGVTTIRVTGSGGGGGGGGGGGTSTCAGGAPETGEPGSGGGGAGAVNVPRSVTVTPGTTYTITVGAGGAGGAPGNTACDSGGPGNTGSVGGNTSFGTLLVLNGGGGGGGGHGWNSALGFWGGSGPGVAGGPGGTDGSGSTGGTTITNTGKGGNGGPGGTVGSRGGDGFLNIEY